MGEDKHTEWKEAWRDEHLKWICGFANAQGGVLEIGRDNKGKAIGVKNASKLLEDIPNKIKETLGIIPEVDQIKEQGKTLIQIKVKSYTHPVNFKGQFYCRSGSTNQELRGSALHHFLLEKTGKTWDSVAVEGAAVSDLDTNAIAKFCEMAVTKKRLNPGILEENNEDLIEKLHLKEEGGLKRAAILLFHPNPEAYFTGAYVKIGYFKDNANILYHDVVRGDLFTQVSKTMDLLLTKYLKAFISYEGLERMETYPVPEQALREAVLNAVIHKDYGTGSPIQISVYEDKIMIWNNGQFPYDWTIEKLIEKHSSNPFNPDIAKVFFLSGMVEAWGRGIEEMIIACRSHKKPEPVFRGETNGLWVEFKNHDIEIKKELRKINGLEDDKKKVTIETPIETRKLRKINSLEKDEQEVTIETPMEKKKLRRINGLEDDKKKVTIETPIEMLKETPREVLKRLSLSPNITISELAKEINRSKSATWRVTQKLKKSGHLERVGSTKTGYWQIIKKK